MPQEIKRCADCKWCRISFGDWLTGYGARSAKCVSPKTQEPKQPGATDLERERWHMGKDLAVPKDEAQPCSLLRSAGGFPYHGDLNCGPEARHFEPKKGRR